MKVSILATLFLLITGLSIGVAQNDFYATRWSSIYRNELKGLPKSALAHVDTIYAKAKREKNTAQIIKALIFQSKFAVTLNENAELLIIRKFEKEIQESRPPAKNILESILANIYWQYFQQHRSVYYQRSRTEEKVNNADFRTWDMMTVFEEIHLHFQRSFLNKEILQKTKLDGLEDILAQSDNSKLYRPTLYDFLSHLALDFYRTTETGIARPALNFVIKDVRYFEAFDQVGIDTPDSLSMQFLALKIYQDLLAFHTQRKDTSAFVSLELERLEFIADNGVFDDATLHQKALVKLRTRYRKHPVSTQIDYKLAMKLFRQGANYTAQQKEQDQFKKQEALAICDEALSLHPKSFGALQCKSLRQTILTPTLELISEDYIPVNTPSRLLVEYSVIDSLTFSAFRVTRKQFMDFQWTLDDSVRIAFFNNHQPLKKWKAALKNAHDYQVHQTEIVVPGLSQGYYILLASVVDQISFRDENMYAYGTMQVTNLTLIQTTHNDVFRYQVMDRNSGKTLEGVQVLLEDDKSTFSENFTTDKNGFVEVAKSKTHDQSLDAIVTSPGDEASFGELYTYRYRHSSRSENEDLIAKSFLFTDRSIYRPGQTVYFKGILMKTKGSQSSVVAGEYVEVFLDDANGTEVATLRLKTNQFGSFSGEFKLPTSGLNGEFSLYADEDSESDSKFYDEIDDYRDNEITIAVEEYKRPTFEATFDPVKETYKVNDSISVHGKAIAFSGSMIGHANVKYEVKRRVRYPAWYNLFHSMHDDSDDEEITFGEVNTSSNGEFTITFKAIPDELIAKEQWPTFHYHITVDVTDINGETRSAETTVNVGYHSMVATLNLPGEMDRNLRQSVITFQTENLNGERVPSKGTIQVYKLEAPKNPLRPRPWPAPDFQVIGKDEFSALFPHDPYTNEDGAIHSRKKGKLTRESNFNSEVSGELDLKIDKSWETGSYVIELNTSDESGNPVVDKKFFDVTDRKSRKVSDNKLLTVSMDKTAYKPGEVATLTVGTASPDLTLVIDIEKDHRITRTLIEHLSGNVRKIKIPVPQTDEPCFFIHYHAVKHNAFLNGSLRIGVTSDTESIAIETVTFRDKLTPGSTETWSFQINGGSDPRKEAELLVSMYDASLDKFREHHWELNPHEPRYYYSYNTTNGNQSFGTENLTIHNYAPRANHALIQRFDRLEWFGFSLNKSDYANQSYLNRLYITDLNEPSKVTVKNDSNRKQGYVYGTITGSDGTPLPGVNVLIKNSTVGTTTDQYGNYMIEADKGDELVFSFVGYSGISATIGGNNTVNVSLTEDVKALSEVVVVGYGTQAKKDLTGAISLRQDNIVLPDYDLSYSLQGKMSGVVVTGGPGGNARIIIRGNSALQNDHALYVVDGVIVEASEISQQDLGSIEILKGDAATAVYGSRGANGVILVSTKSGQRKMDDELLKIKARSDLKETAFFFPHLKTDENGIVSFTFTTPEALTRWKLQALAHTKKMVTAVKTLQAITQKELMVTPNVPRFLREGDEVVFSAKVANLSSRGLDGQVALLLSDPVSGNSIDEKLEHVSKSKAFKVTAKGSTQVSWTLKIPSGLDAVQYKVVAKAGEFSDGEQNALPVLTNRMLVTETMPMMIRSGETKTFTLEKLKTNTSSTLRHHQVTLEVTSNPAWYAVQALPYLMEFPHECAEQLFSRYYANTLATHIANSNSVIQEVFKKWASSDALISALEKNQELKSIIIQETPWLRDAQSETEQKKRIGLLFDLQTMKDKSAATINKLTEMQLGDGGFPWFAGGHSASRFITQHVASGFGHLRHLNVIPKNDAAEVMIHKAIGFLDGEMVKTYKRLLAEAQKIRDGARSKTEGVHLGKEFLDQRHVYSEHIQYLYMRTFFRDIQINAELLPAVEYYRTQSKKYWKDVNLYLKAMIALIHFRAGDISFARNIMASLKESSVVGEDRGMYWKENEAGWNWYQAPVETQALLIEAFGEIEKEDPALSDEAKTETIDALRVWLLLNKQTSQWKTTKATTEAIYALLLSGTDWLSVHDAVEITVGSGKIIPGQKGIPDAEAGTGYIKTSWKADHITPSLSQVTLHKKEKGIAWGSLYWQYFEDLDRITPAETPLQLAKKVFLVENTARGELLKPVDETTSLKPGDLLRVRIELKADRPMEFLHMKDMRASGLEPVSVLSEYKWQDGLGYYESTKDASTNFFFDELPKGVYVFEYDLRVNNQGNFSNGITTIQSMYAPEFSSHSEGIRILVK